MKETYWVRFGWIDCLLRLMERELICRGPPSAEKDVPGLLLSYPRHLVHYEKHLPLAVWK